MFIRGFLNLISSKRSSGILFHIRSFHKTHYRRPSLLPHREGGVCGHARKEPLPQGLCADALEETYTKVPAHGTYLRRSHHPLHLHPRHFSQEHRTELSEAAAHPAHQRDEVDGPKDRQAERLNRRRWWTPIVHETNQARQSVVWAIQRYYQRHRLCPPRNRSWRVQEAIWRVVALRI